MVIGLVGFVVLFIKATAFNPTLAEINMADHCESNVIVSPIVILCWLFSADL